MFDEAGVRATFFVLGWVAERFPQLVRDIAAGGHELASHSYEHRLVYATTPKQFREDLRRAKGALEAAAGVPVLGYRAPSYSITRESLWALDVLIEEGYRLRFEHLSRFTTIATASPTGRDTSTGSSDRAARSGSCRVRRFGGLARTFRSAAAAISGSCRTAGRAAAFSG